MGLDDANRSATWDWTSQEDQDLYYASQPDASPTKFQYRLPFRIGGHRLAGTRGDLHAKDGWMLVHRDFGTPARGVPMPYFTLYNKYRGLFRVVLFNAAQREDSIYLGELTLRSPGERQESRTPVFTFGNQAGKCFSDDYDLTQRESCFSVMYRYGDWAAFDFNLLGYDPDLAAKDPILQFRMTGIQRSRITGTIDGDLRLDQILSRGWFPQVSSSGNAGALDGLIGAWSNPSMQDWLTSLASDQRFRDEHWMPVVRSFLDGVERNRQRERERDRPTAPSGLGLGGGAESRAAAAEDGSGAGAARSAGDIVTGGIESLLVSAFGGILNGFAGGSNQSSAWEPLSFQGQIRMDLKGWIEREANLLSLSLGMNQTESKHISFEVHRPVQKVPWGLFNLREMPKVTGFAKGPLFRQAWLPEAPTILVNPDAGMQLVSTKYHLNLHLPEWGVTRSGKGADAETKRVVTGMGTVAMAFGVKQPVDLGQKALVKDMLVELRFRAEEETRDADRDFTVLKRVPLKWADEVPGAYALDTEYKDDTYMFIRMKPTS
jgi:hypothetical protein